MSKLILVGFVAVVLGCDKSQVTSGIRLGPRLAAQRGWGSWEGSMEAAWEGSMEAAWEGSMEAAWEGSMEAAWEGSMEAAWEGNLDVLLSISCVCLAVHPARAACGRCCDELPWCSWHGAPGMVLRAWCSWHGAPGMVLRAWCSGHGAPGMVLRAWCSGHGAPGMCLPMPPMCSQMAATRQ